MKTATRKARSPHTMSPELQRKIAQIAAKLQETLINLRVQADAARKRDACDLDDGSPVYIVQLLAREAERQVGAIQSLAGDY